MHFMLKSVAILLVLLSLVSGACGIKISVSTEDATGSSSYSETVKAKNDDIIKENVLFDGPRLQKAFHGSGDRSETFSVTNNAGDNAKVGYKIEGSSGYFGEYALSPKDLDYARADMRLDVDYADSIEAFASARSRYSSVNTFNDAGSSVLISQGSLIGYKNSAYSTEGLAKASQSCDVASGNSVGLYGGAWNKEGQSLQFQTLVNGTVTGYSNSAKARAISEMGTQKFESVSGKWYIQECALDYTGPEAGNSAGSFWWGEGTIENYLGSTKAALNQKIACAGADLVAGNAIFGTDSISDFNNPGTQDSLVNLFVENGYIEDCQNEAKFRSKGRQYAQSSQEIDSFRKLNGIDGSIVLEALAMNSRIGAPYSFNFIGHEDLFSEMKVVARSSSDNLSIEYHLPSTGGDEEGDWNGARMDKKDINQLHNLD